MESRSKSVSDPRYLLLGTTPSDTDKEITGTRLPTSQQVLLCFLAHHADRDVTIRTAANLTSDQVLPFYHKARIPVIAATKVAGKVIELFNEMKGLLKKKEEEKIKAFKEKLPRTMKFWPRDAKKRITIQEDLDFLLSMESVNREASMGVTDALLATTERKVEGRKTSAEERERIERERKASANAVVVHEDEPEDEEPNVPYTPVTPTRSHKRSVKTGSPAFWPPDVLKHPEVVEAATRNKITATQLSAVTHALVYATSADPSKLNLNARTAYK